ncbi:nickel insertion protein [Desulfovibrio aminophilus]|uniref:LarC family nickel insertion protein n=1 Tax=Desulfovibrio aminophilus TaxID=81425 RepID=UPI0033961E65
MPTLYLDCTTGVSGDMLLASLSDAGRLCSYLEEQMAKLPLPGFRLEFAEARVAGIVTRRARVLQTASQPLRHLEDLTRIVEDAPYSEWVRKEALAVLRLLGEAEARVHGLPLEKVHFHEIGAVDTVVDVTGTLLLVEKLGVKRVAASAVNLGSGFVEIAHGRLPVPAPACAELAKGMRAFSTDIGMETATPTGLSLIKRLATTYGPLPEGVVRAVGYGSGTRSTDERPTFVRAFLIDEDEGDAA